MFDKATRTFKCKVDRTGNLISVENINDGLKLAPLTLVIRKIKSHSVKYEIMDYTLYDILDESIQPSDVKTEDFLIDHSHTSEKGGDASLTVEAVAGSVGSSTKGKVTDDQSFSALKKDSVDVKNLIKGYGGRKIPDTNKKLLPKLQKGETLTVVKERIYTSSDVELSGSREIEAGIMGKLKTFLGFQLGAKYKDSTSCTIPEGTAVAYSLMGVQVEETTIEFSLRPVRPKMYPFRASIGTIKRIEIEERSSVGTMDRGYVLMEMAGMSCLPVTMGSMRHRAIRGYMLMRMAGMSSMPVTTELEHEISDISEDTEAEDEIDEISEDTEPAESEHLGHQIDEISEDSEPVHHFLESSLTLAIKPETSDNTSQSSFKTLHQVQEELQKKETVLQPLAELQQSSRSALIQRLCELLDNREDLTDLEDTLEKWCDDDTSNLPKSQSACEILNLLQTSSADPTALLTAAHLLVSMMDALPGPIPSALAKCSPDTLRGLTTLVNNLKVNGQSPPPDSLPGSLQEGGEFSWTAEILCSTSETLEELKDLWVETGVEPGVFLLALCITVQGLSLLQA